MSAEFEQSIGTEYLPPQRKCCRYTGEPASRREDKPSVHIGLAAKIVNPLAAFMRQGSSTVAASADGQTSPLFYWVLILECTPKVRQI
jgi:hypothetical protein